MAQELPEAASKAILAYSLSEYTRSGETMVVELDRFPSAEAVRSEAARLGMASGTNTEVVRCDEQKERCYIEGGERLIRLIEYEVVDPGREIRVQVVVSEEWESPDGSRQRIFPSLRSLLLRNDGGWFVADDELLIAG